MIDDLLSRLDHGSQDRDRFMAAGLPVVRPTMTTPSLAIREPEDGRVLLSPPLRLFAPLDVSSLLPGLEFADLPPDRLRGIGHANLRTSSLPTAADVLRAWNREVLIVAAAAGFSARRPLRFSDEDRRTFGTGTIERIQGGRSLAVELARTSRAQRRPRKNRRWHCQQDHSKSGQHRVAENQIEQAPARQGRVSNPAPSNPPVRHADKPPRCCLTLMR